MDRSTEGLITAPVPTPDSLRTSPRLPAISGRLFLWRRMRRERNVVIGLIFLGLLVATAVAAPWLAPRNPARNDLAHALRPPGSEGFLLGTDNLGRDILSRVIWGSRISLMVGVIVQIVAVSLGTLLGLLGGFYGGRTDDLVSSLTNVMLALPRLLFAMAIVSALGPNFVNLFIALGAVGWPAICRLVRAQTLSLCGKDFVEAARAIGARDLRIIMRHILPNALSPIIVLATVGMAQTVLAEASLSFLGLGVQPPMASWGSMMSRGQAYIWHAPWLMLFPGLAIFITVVGLNLLGDGLRDALDPQLRRR